MAPKAKKPSAFTEFIRSIFDTGDNSGLERALLRYVDNIPDLLAIDLADIANLQYEDGANTGQFLDVMLGHKTRVRAFQVFCIQRENNGESIEDEDLAKLTSKELERFLKSAAWHYHSRGSPIVPITSGGLIAPTSSGTIAPPASATQFKSLLTAADTFRKGIKRDQALFPEFKNDEEWDEWNRRLITQVRAQGQEDVLKKDHTPPPGSDAYDLFMEQQKYMFAVFERCIKTQNGKRIVRDNFASGDAQNTYQELLLAYEKSTKSGLVSADLLTYIIQSRLDDGKWKGSAENFILHWCDQCRKYDALVPTAESLGDAQKRLFLQTAVAEISPLAQIKTTGDQLQAQTGDVMNFDKYLTLLTSAAQQFDRTQRTLGGASRRQRVYATTFGEEITATDDHHSNYNDFGVDTPISTISAYRTQFLTDSRMKRETWQQLSPEEQQIWDQLSDATKAIILKSQPSQPPSGSRPDHRSRRPNTSRGRVPRSVNLHNVSAAEFLEDYLSAQDSSTLSFEGETYIDSNEDANDDDSNLLETFIASVTKTEPAKSTLKPTLKLADAPAGHLAKVLSSKYSRKPDSVKSKEKSVSISNFEIIYTVSGRNMTKAPKDTVLGDRGANGSVCGKEMRVIDTGITLPTVHVRGFDKHEQRNIPLVAAGGVMQTNKGPVIGIVSFAAHMPQHNTILSCIQMEHYGCDVNDKSVKVKGGLQRIITKEGYVIPFNLRGGLPYIQMRQFTDEEWETIPHVFLTHQTSWNPEVYDQDGRDTEAWQDAVQQADDFIDVDTDTDAMGNYRHLDVQYTYTFMECSEQPSRSMCISVNKYDA